MGLVRLSYPKLDEISRLETITNNWDIHKKVQVDLLLPREKQTFSLQNPYIFKQQGDEWNEKKENINMMALFDFLGTDTLKIVSGFNLYHCQVP